MGTPEPRVFCKARRVLNTRWDVVGVGVGYLGVEEVHVGEGDICNVRAVIHRRVQLRETLLLPPKQ